MRSFFNRLKMAKNNSQDHDESLRMIEWIRLYWPPEGKMNLSPAKDTHMDNTETYEHITDSTADSTKVSYMFTMHYDSF